LEYQFAVNLADMVEADLFVQSRPGVWSVSSGLPDGRILGFSDELVLLARRDPSTDDVTPIDAVPLDWLQSRRDSAEKLSKWLGLLLGGDAGAHAMAVGWTAWAIRSDGAVFEVSEGGYSLYRSHAEFLARSHVQRSERPTVHRDETARDSTASQHDQARMSVPTSLVNDPTASRAQRPQGPLTKTLRWVAFLPIGFVLIAIAQVVVVTAAERVPFWLAGPLILLFSVLIALATAVPVRIAPNPVVGAAILLTLFMLFETVALVTFLPRTTLFPAVARLYSDVVLMCGGIFATRLPTTAKHEGTVA